MVDDKPKLDQKLSVKPEKCPKCGSKNSDEDYHHCWHCLDCGYCQCMEVENIPEK